jgi:hypothetical protein
MIVEHISLFLMWCVCVFPSLVGARCRVGDDFKDEAEMIASERRRNGLRISGRRWLLKGHRQLAPLDKVLDTVFRNLHGKWRWGGQ